MNNTGGKRAWDFVRRNPDHILDWCIWASETPPAQGEPFPIREQTPADLEAAKWGLLAWKDPLAEDGPVSPFWADAPTLEAVPTSGNAIFAELLEQEGTRLEGLRLATGGAMILKVERGNAAVQLRIADADAFDAAGGAALITPTDLKLRAELHRAADLWPFGAPKANRDVSVCLTRSSSWPWTWSRRECPSGRLARRFARRGGSPREDGRTVRCARWRAAGSRRASG